MSGVDIIMLNGIEEDLGKIRFGRRMSNGLRIFKKVNPLFATARNSYLLLLRLNFRGHARIFASNPTAYRQFRDKWHKQGGDVAVLDKAINKGKNKKAILGQKKLNGLGSVTAVATAIATAMPLITSASAILKNLNIREADQGEYINDDELNNEAKNFNDDEIERGSNKGEEKNGKDKEKQGLGKWIKEHPVLSATIGVTILGGGLMLIPGVRHSIFGQRKQSLQSIELS